MGMYSRKTRINLPSGVLVASLALAGCAPSSDPGAAAADNESSRDENDTGAGNAEDFDLDELIAAAQEEGELVVYNTSSRVVEAAELFEAEYGISTDATKIGDPEQAERVKREVDSGNVQVGVIGFEDATLLEGDLLPQGYVSSWFPPDLAEDFEERYQDPAVYAWFQRTFAYNTEVYDECPISNIWELTEPEWHGNVALRDPMTTPPNFSFFSQLITDHEILESAYEDHYGESLDTAEENAGWEFLRRFVDNSPVIGSSDGDIGDAVGAAGQSDPPMGLFVYTKFRDVEAAGLDLGLCREMEPFIGYGLPLTLAIVEDAPSPHAAQLFVRFLLTDKGVSPWSNDVGTVSTNPNVPMHPDDDFGDWSVWEEELLFYDVENAVQLNPQVRDFWLTNLNS